MPKPTYEELELKLEALELKADQAEELEDKITHLEHQLLQVEKQLMQRQRMDALGTLAQGVAHDFNNILSGIMAYLNILSLTSDNFSPSQKTYIQNIINSVKRGAATIHQFQKLSNRNSSKKTAVDLYIVAREVFYMLEETTDKIIEKRLDFKKGMFFVHADINEIHQVLMNLGTNAAQAIEQKGVQKGDYISLSVNPVPVKGSDFKFLSRGDFYQFFFEDTGSGMPAHVLEKAFDPLFTTKQVLENQGQGLGLAMVHDIINKRHGGHIEISSTVGKGTVFQFFLPRASTNSSPDTPQLSVQGGTETLLVVDDDTSVRESIKTALEDFGYHVITARDGEEGLEQFKKNQDIINAVLMDMVMPKMSGKQLLRHLLKIDPDIKVIIASGHRKEHHNDKIIQSAKKYLNKPFEIDELETVLRQVLDL